MGRALVLKRHVSRPFIPANRLEEGGTGAVVPGLMDQYMDPLAGVPSGDVVEAEGVTWFDSAVEGLPTI